MKKIRSRSERRVSLKITRAGIGCAVLYWVIDSIIHMHFLDDRSLFSHMLTPAPSELWTRMLVCGVLIAFGAMAQFYFSRSERNLRDEQRRVRAQYKAIPIPAYTWQMRDGDLVLTDYNDAARSFTRGRIIEWVGSRVREMYSERPDIVEAMHRCINERSSDEREIDYRMLTTGEQKRLAAKYAFVPPDSVVVLTEDITEKVLAETEREQLQQRWQSLVENTPNIVLIVDRKGQILYLNRTTVRDSVDEIVGLSIYDFIYPEHHAEVRDVIARVFDTGESGEYEALIGPEDKSAWYLTQVGSIKQDGEVVAATLIATDITERKLAQEVLEETQQNLEKRIKERTLELATMLEISNSVATTLRMEPSLRKILDELSNIVDYDVASVQILEGDVLVAKSIRSSVAAPAENEPVPISGSRLALQVVDGKETLAIPDARAHEHGAWEFMSSIFPPEDVSRVRSLAIVPIVAGDQTVGLLSVGHHHIDFYDIKQLKLMAAFADLAALAFEHDKFHAQGRQLAVMSERERLARELHDSVTQTLFSANLVADSLPGLWERDHAEGRRRLEDLQQMTRVALAEMRTLLFELRPGSLDDADLGDLLRQLVASIGGRGGVPIKVNVEGVECVAPEAKVVFYRVAQEALNNIIKHARAENASVSLRFSHGFTEMYIEDDGIGFDLDNISQLRMGIAIMRERTDKIGAGLEIVSRVNEGTRIMVSYQGTG